MRGDCLSGSTGEAGAEGGGLLYDVLLEYADRNSECAERYAVWRGALTEG